jgi:hypothetical protein
LGKIKKGYSAVLGMKVVNLVHNSNKMEKFTTLYEWKSYISGRN